MESAQKDMMQIASSLAEFERVEAVGMRSATLSEKIDALLRDLVYLRRKDRESLAERDALRLRLAEVERELLATSDVSDKQRERAKRAERNVESLMCELGDALREREVALARAKEAERTANRLASEFTTRLWPPHLLDAVNAALAYEVEP